MKHSYWLLLGGIVCGGVLLLAQDDQVEMGTVKGSRVNVRARPLGTAEICCQMNKGDSVEILEHRLVQTLGTNTEEWVRIVLPEKATVWVQSSFVDQDGKVTSKLNGRAGPGLVWPVLCSFAKGDHVSTRTNELDWVGVVPPRTASAWISGHFVTGQVVEIHTAPVAKPE